MSLWEKVKKVAKETIDDLKLQNEKRTLLNALHKNDLLILATKYGIPVTKKMDKDEIAGKMAKHKPLSIKSIMAFSRRVEQKGKPIKLRPEELEVEKEVTTVRKVRTRVIRKPPSIERKILRKLKTFRPVGTKLRERVIEGQLVSKFYEAFSEDIVDYQRTRKSGRTDIVIDDKYGIELKVVSSRSDLTRLLGQIFQYSKDYKKVFLWMYDERRKIKPVDIKELKSNLAKMGISNVEVIKKS